LDVCQMGIQPSKIWDNWWITGWSNTNRGKASDYCWNFPAMLDLWMVYNNVILCATVKHMGCFPILGDGHRSISGYKKYPLYSMIRIPILLDGWPHRPYNYLALTLAHIVGIMGYSVATVFLGIHHPPNIGSQPANMDQS
jgi:hypothetical protein